MIRACEEQGNSEALQAWFGNQALILQGWGRLEEALALHENRKRSAWNWITGMACREPTGIRR
jgi:hypothetical protein